MLVVLVLCFNVYLMLIHLFLWKRFIQDKNDEPGHEISDNVICATSKDSDQPAHSQIRAFASHLDFL